MVLEIQGFGGLWTLEVNSKMSQFSIYICPLFFRFFSHIGHYRVLSRVASAVYACLVTQPCWTFCDPMSLPGSSFHEVLQTDTGVGCYSLLQGIFLTYRLNLGLLHCRWILYRLSHQESLCNTVGLYYQFYVQQGIYFSPSHPVYPSSPFPLVTISLFFTFVTIAVL